MRSVAIIHGIYFLVTGLWPLISIRTFQIVTGPKTDLWLVKTVGAVIAVIGLTILVAALNFSPGPEAAAANGTANLNFPIFLLAVASCLALCVVDINYSVKGVISKIYLLDAAIEICLVAGWIIGWISG
jgi:hypothetical protein